MKEFAGLVIVCALGAMALAAATLWIQDKLDARILKRYRVSKRNTIIRTDRAKVAQRQQASLSKGEQ